MQIHELNNYGGELGSEAYLAVDDGNDTGKVSADGLLSGIKSELLQAEADLNGRIDNIISPSGTAPNPTEVIDARQGADTVTYPNLGDAIRGQYKLLQNQLIVTCPASITESGKYVSYSNGGIYDFGSTSYVTLNVEKVRYINYMYTVPSPDLRGLAFYNAADNVVGGVQALSSMQTMIEVPDGAVTCKATVRVKEQLALVISADDLLAARDAIDLVSKEVKALQDDSIINHPTAYAETGKYIAYNDGGAYPLTGNKYVEANVESAKYVNYYYAHSILDSRGLAFYDRNGIYISGVQALTEEQAFIPVPTGAVICKATVIDVDDLVLVVELDPILQMLTSFNYSRYNDMITHPVEFTEEGKYISYSSGAIQTFGSLKYVSFNVKKAKYVNYFYTVPVADERGLAFYDENDSYISGVQTLPTPQMSIPIPNGAVLCRATTTTLEGVGIVIDVESVLDAMAKADAIAPEGRNILSAFKNITCIGDSLTYSQVYTGVGVSRQAYNPYPYVLGKLTGASVESLARSGYNPYNCWTNYGDQIVSKMAQLFIMYLGTNDGLTDTLEEDAPPGTSYTTWSSTNTGCYAKLIAKAQSVGGRVLLIKCYASSGDRIVTNNVIDQLGARFNCPVIEPINLTDVKYHYYPDLSGSNGVHYNDLGYSAFTDALIKAVGALDTNDMKYIIPQ